MIDEKQKYEDIARLKQIKNELPEQCKNCSFLEITNLREGKVFCPYRINERCLIK